VVCDVREFATIDYGSVGYTKPPKAVPKPACDVLRRSATSRDSKSSRCPGGGIEDYRRRRRWRPLTGSTFGEESGDGGACVS
jgi:hypothetical protein